MLIGRDTSLSLTLKLCHLCETWPEEWAQRNTLLNIVSSLGEFGHVYYYQVHLGTCLSFAITIKTLVMYQMGFLNLYLNFNAQNMGKYNYFLKQYINIF